MVYLPTVHDSSCSSSSSSWSSCSASDPKGNCCCPPIILFVRSTSTSTPLYICFYEKVNQKKFHNKQERKKTNKQLLVLNSDLSVDTSTWHAIISICSSTKSLRLGPRHSTKISYFLGKKANKIRTISFWGWKKKN